LNGVLDKEPQTPKNNKNLLLYSYQLNNGHSYANRKSQARFLNIFLDILHNCLLSLSKEE